MGTREDWRWEGVGDASSRNRESKEMPRKDTPEDLSDTKIAKIYRDRYEEYIQSESWKAKRRQFFAENRRRLCAGCQDKSIKQLHVHHKTYARFGNEDLADLVAVCQVCHAMIHERHRLGGISLEEATDQVLAKIRLRTGKASDEKVAKWQRPKKKTPVRKTKVRMASLIANDGNRRPDPGRRWQAENAHYVKLRQDLERRRRELDCM